MAEPRPQHTRISCLCPYLLIWRWFSFLSLLPGLSTTSLYVLVLLWCICSDRLCMKRLQLHFILQSCVVNDDELNREVLLCVVRPRVRSENHFCVMLSFSVKNLFKSWILNLCLLPDVQMIYRSRWRWESVHGDK